MDLFQQDYAKLIEWDKSTISRYDPNRETFKINIPDLDEIVIHVPIEHAKQLKEDWHKVEFKNKRCVQIDGNWQLSSLDIENSMTGYTVNYNSELINVYDPTNQFAFDLEPVDIEIPTQTTNKLIKNDALDEPYSINTNLPKTNMSNPDAIAVIIGNTNYKSISPVKFAINDAQLMKVYLTNVLGYKPGNIMFEKDLTKGEMENIFGTNENFKGKLFDWVKPDTTSEVFIFYSGHGAPGIYDKEAYFLPVDSDPGRIEISGYPLGQFYNNLAKVPAKSVSVVLDACFSGTGVFKNISSVRIKPKDIYRNRY